MFCDRETLSKTHTSACLCSIAYTTTAKRFLTSLYLKYSQLAVATLTVSIESFHRRFTVVSMEIWTGQRNAENSGGLFRLGFVVIMV